MANRETFNRYDGHIYYVVDSDGSRRAYVGIVFVERYDELNEWRGQPGLFFVRDAACDPTGQHGDPTVHEGWAMYTWDAYFRDHNGGWRKVAEQESVDGPWGIDERILNMLVKKTEFNAKMAIIDGQIDDLKSRVQDIETQINSLIDDVNDIKKYKHWHENKDSLDAVGEVGGQMTFHGAPVGYCFFYNNIKDGSIIWVDPTKDSPDPVIVSNSFDLAQKFCRTSMAWYGQTLEVAEVDGSISKYMIVQDPTERGEIMHPITDRVQICSNRFFVSATKNSEEEEPVIKDISLEEALVLFDNPVAGTTIYFYEGKLYPRNVSNCVKNSVGGITYVETLPTDSITWDNRGLWCPLYDDGVHAPFKMYVSKYGTWVNVEEEYGSGVNLQFPAAQFSLVYQEDDPRMVRNLLHFFWNEPEERVYLDRPVRWGKTYLVRKLGSAPVSIEDGEIVKVVSDREIGPKGIVIAVPYCRETGSDDEMHYRLFSETVSGSKYIAGESVVPRCLEWSHVLDIIRNGNTDKILKVGDTLTLPDHPKYGQLDCQVISISSDSIHVITRDVLDVMKFGDNNIFDESTLSNWLNDNFSEYTHYHECVHSRRAEEGKEYFIYDNGYQKLNISAGEEFPEGIRVFEKEDVIPVKGADIPDAFAAEYDFTQIDKNKHYAGQKAAMDWWTKNPMPGNTVITALNPNGTAVTTQLGVVVVFKIG